MPEPSHSSSIEYSPEWWQGYHCMLPKTRNPYTAGQPWLAEHPDPVVLRKMKDWDDGWHVRFYGENPHESA